MTNALLILIILSVFLLMISFVIWKSSMPENDKILSLIMILGVFSMVAILNESKRSFASKNILPLQNIDIQKLSAKSLERNFYEYDQPEIQFEVSNKDYVNIFDNLPKLILISGRGTTGKTTILRNILRIKHNDGIPILYLDTKGIKLDDEKTLNDLFKIEHLYVLDETIEKINKDNKVASIIIDNLLMEGNCKFCSSLYFIFKKRKINLVFVTNSTYTAEIIKNDKNFFNKIEIKKWEDKLFSKNNNFSSYNEINSKINDKNKIIGEKEIKECEKITEINWELINSYLKNYKNFANFQAFCNGKIKELSSEIFKNHNDLADFLKEFLKLTIDKSGGGYSNKYIPYSQIKNLPFQNVDILLEKSLSFNLIEIEDSKYRIAQKAIFSALILQFG